MIAVILMTAVMAIIIVCLWWRHKHAKLQKSVTESATNSRDSKSPAQSGSYEENQDEIAEMDKSIGPGVGNVSTRTITNMSARTITFQMSTSEMIIEESAEGCNGMETGQPVHTYGTPREGAEMGVDL